MAGPPLPRGDSYGPRLAQPPPTTTRPMFHFHGNDSPRKAEGRDRRRRPRHEFTFLPRPKVSERPLLTKKHEESKELTFDRPDTGDRFREVEDLTDSDESEMDLSISEDEGRPRKQARLGERHDHNDSALRWSNPDPYTSLPPLEDSQRKRKDVVKLIRKARIETVQTNDAGKAITNGEDFISFDMGTEDEDEDDATSPPAPPLNAPTGPRSNAVPNTQTLRNADIPRTDTSQTLGKRKRDGFGGKKIDTESHAKGMVLDEWQASGSINSTPWLRSPPKHDTKLPGALLHQEIVDFYEWIRPKDYETAVRADIIQRLQRAFERLEPGGQLKSFGSFAAGLYLPTGDIDLVYLRNSFRGHSTLANGSLMKPPKKLLFAFSAFISNQGLARDGTVQVITGAKVPIIKFVEKISGLKVDLCFDNDTGVLANQTFQQWKVKYPAMPIIVAVVKHFLMMRGLNDVSIGGLGGFSVICLVTSLIQHLPQSSQPPNLGTILVEFFNVYGNLFNRYDIAIRLDPPAYLDKRTYGPFAFNRDKPSRLAIIDPNRPDNNISGGSNEIETIFRCFSEAHELLQMRLQHQMDHPATGISLLEDLVGGDFSAYDVQRRSLHDLFLGAQGAARN